MPISKPVASFWWSVRTDEDRRRVAGGYPGGVAALAHEVVLQLGRIDTATLGMFPILGRGGEHRRPLPVELDELSGNRLTLGRIGGQQRGIAAALEDRSELPAEVERVLHRHVHALSGLGAVGVAGVAGDEHSRHAQVTLLRRRRTYQ